MVVVAANPPAAQKKKAPAADPLAGLDAYVESAMRNFRVPGVAIAIVRNDSVILAKEYGVRKLDDSAPVDSKTLFAIGSSSKAFTATSAAMLVDEGSWHTPI
jgi:CubicO group peptidase (beta-lactamase class C family)